MITVVLGIFLAILLDQPFWGQGIVRILVIAPFFVMPTVSALVWKNMLMDPVNGVFAHLWRFFGAEPDDLFEWLVDRMPYPPRPASKRPHRPVEPLLKAA